MIRRPSLLSFSWFVALASHHTIFQDSWLVPSRQIGWPEGHHLIHSAFRKRHICWISLVSTSSCRQWPTHLIYPGPPSSVNLTGWSDGGVIHKNAFKRGAWYLLPRFTGPALPDAAFNMTSITSINCRGDGASHCNVDVSVTATGCLPLLWEPHQKAINVRFQHLLDVGWDMVCQVGHLKCTTRVSFANTVLNAGRD